MCFCSFQVLIFHQKCEIEKEGKKQRKKENNNSCYVSVFVVVDYSMPVGRACGASVWFAFNSLRSFNCCRDGHYSHGLDVPAAHSAPPPTGPEQASAGGWPGGGQGPLCIPCWQTSPALRRGCLDGAAQVSMQSAHSSSISSPPLFCCFLPGSKPCDLTYNISVNIMNRVLWQRKIMQLAHGWGILLLLFLAAFFLEASLVIWIDQQYQYKCYEQGVTAEENNSTREGKHGGSIVLEKELLWVGLGRFKRGFFPYRSGNVILCRGARQKMHGNQQLKGWFEESRGWVESMGGCVRLKLVFSSLFEGVKALRCDGVFSLVFVVTVLVVDLFWGNLIDFFNL